MIRSRAIPRSLLAVLAVLLASAPADGQEDAGSLIRRARKDTEAGRYARAESTFARAARMAEGNRRYEALLGQAGLVRSAEKAEELYARIVAEDPAGEWGRRAAFESAKIQFATGRYEAAHETLRDHQVCEDSDEACLFEGMSAVMLRRYGEALAPLERVEKGRLKMWATVALGEAEAGLGRGDQACRRYEALARARVSPTAWYRYALCLEQREGPERAQREYESLADAFPHTPEAVTAEGKLTAMRSPGRDEALPTPDPDADVSIGPGFTVQFGSFGDRSNAIRLAAKIKKVYPGVRIDGELVNYREVFRVRYGHFKTREEARARGEQMSRDLEEEFTVMPVPGASNER